MPEHAIAVGAVDLVVESGDVGRRPAAIRSFRISRSRGRLTLILDRSIRADVPTTMWRGLYRQVRERTLTRWKHFDVGGPLGTPRMRRLVMALDSTASYQLFLAAFDIANYLRLPYASNEQVETGFAELSDRRIGGQSGDFLYFLPTSWEMEQEVVETLIVNNKLCRATISSREGRYRVSRLHTPYLTPSGFASAVGNDVIRAWNEVRSRLAVAH